MNAQPRRKPPREGRADTVPRPPPHSYPGGCPAGPRGTCSHGPRAPRASGACAGHSGGRSRRCGDSRCTGPCRSGAGRLHQDVAPSQNPSGSGGPMLKPRPCTKMRRGWWGGRHSLRSHLQGRGADGSSGVHAYREAVVGEEVSDCVAPFSGVGGEGRTAKEAGETGGSGDGLGSHI